MKSEPLKILLVEGSENVRTLVSTHLLLMGDQVSLRHVRSLADARTILAEETPDLILANFKLPDGSGAELLLDNDHDPLYPVLLLASHRADRFATTTFRSGALDYIPLTPAELADLPYLIERALREWQRLRQCRDAEDALRQKQETYRLLFEHMTEALALDELVCDDQGNPVDWRVLDINPAYEEILEIPRKQAVGRLASEIYGHSMDIAPILDVYSRVALTGSPEQMELFFPHSKRYLLVSVFALGDGRFATLSTNITTRRKIEAENKRLLAELEATINSIAEAVVIYRPDGHIERMNPAAEKLLGYSEENRGKPFIERISGLKLETPNGEGFPLVETMQRVFAGEVLCGVIAVLKQPDGRAVWISNSAAPIRGHDGTLLGAVGISTDITALHELQEQRDLCLHSVSHDLRSPMTIIQGYAEILQEKIAYTHVDGDCSRSIEEMLKGIQKMTCMIDDLVETARSEGGQIRLDKTLIRLETMVQELIVSYTKVLDIARLRIDIPDDLPPLYVDLDRMERILVNLLSNALKYSSPPSPVHLTAAMSPEMVTISISDSGDGIDPVDLPRIFDRFYRGRGQRRMDSVGLGLYITKRLIEAHGGWISVESKLSVGSTFTITLPRSLEWEREAEHLIVP